MEGLLNAMVAKDIPRESCLGLALKLGLNSIEDFPHLESDCLDSVPWEYKRAIIDLRNAHVAIYTTKWHPLHFGLDMD
jgi:hypothetical protein